MERGGREGEREKERGWREGERRRKEGILHTHTNCLGVEGRQY